MEFRWEPYGSAMVIKLSGGLDGQGHVVSWSHELWTLRQPARFFGGPMWRSIAAAVTPERVKQALA